ncbi:MAG: glycerophosphodiester phosphodiesterase family protein [Agriterribacter sp.]
MYSKRISLIFILFSFIGYAFAQQQQYYLIAHRGGVVDSTYTENGLPALLAAVKRGYKMVEVDLRMTKDSILIIQHDNNFKKYYGLNQPVAEINWEEISGLRSDKDGCKVLRFEEVLQHCAGKIQVMIDNKIEGSDTAIFSKVVKLLKQYRLDKDALMIGTDSSTDYFTGKIKLSCTRKQLEENMLKPGYSSSHYYLFGADLTKEDVMWALQKNILAVGVVNEWRYKRSKATKEDIEKDIQRLKDTGLKYFQIDSMYDKYFSRNK